jgi:uncharacterized protein
MEFTERINNDLKQAMLKREKEKLEAIRAVKAAFMIAKTEKGAGSELTDAEEIKILQKLVKQRKDSAAIYKDQNRNDLFDKEILEASVIEAYLPAQMNSEDVKKIVSKIITDTGAAGIKDMGKVMGAATKELAGKADGKMISGIVKELLSEN